MGTLQIRHFIELSCDTPVCAAQKMVIGFTLDECERKALKLSWILSRNWEFFLYPACSALLKARDAATAAQPTWPQPAR